MLSNVVRYLKNTFNFEFKTFSQMHDMLKDHHQFQSTYKGDMFVYDEKKGDAWSGYYGSKPDLKMKIREIFDMYRSTSALMFIVRAEYEKLKDYKYDNPLLQQ